METASDFFGVEFNSKPVSVEQAAPQTPTQPKGLVSSALEFFGIDLATRTAPTPKEAPVAPPDRFETVFSSLVNQESGGKHTDAKGNLLTSSAGAQGITQVLPKTASDPGYGVQPLQGKSQDEYVRFGKDYLRAMLNEFGGDYKAALAAYNAGPGVVKKAMQGGGDWLSKMPQETKTYVNRILR